MLDYKIKELKKQIEPRENEIKVMKEQIQEVRAIYDTLTSQGLFSPALSLAGLERITEDSSTAPLCFQGMCSSHSTQDAWKALDQLTVHSIVLQDLTYCGTLSGLWPHSHLSVWVQVFKRNTQLLGVLPPGGSVYSTNRLTTKHTPGTRFSNGKCFVGRPSDKP